MRGQPERIIHRSPASGIPPVVVGPDTRPQLRTELQAALLGMAGDPAGQTSLATAGIERFVTIEDSVYDSARELETRVTH